MSAIRFENVSKVYDLKSGSRTVMSSIRSVLGKPDSDTMLYALKDVSFDIRRGEAFGIIGRNGAGKSTLLKIIAGITRQTSGQVTVNGLVSSLIELGAGFHPDLTGRENIYMSGALLGIPRRKMDEKFNEIVDFAELWKFIDVPVKKYSSGMYARLGFSVAVSIEPEILIVDEILSVGDVFFQQKCFKKMEEIIGLGSTFIFVSHDTTAMHKLCRRTMLLDQGVVEFIGSTIEAISRYYATIGSKPGSLGAEKRELQIPATPSTSASVDPKEIRLRSIDLTNVTRHGQRDLQIVAVRITDDSGRDTMHVSMGGKLRFSILIESRKDCPDPSCGIHLYNRTGTLVFAAGSRQLRKELGPVREHEALLVVFDLTLDVSPGEYTFSLGVSERVEGDRPNVGYVQDRHEMLGPIVVRGDESQVYPFYGVARLPLTLSGSYTIKI